MISQKRQSKNNFAITVVPGPMARRFGEFANNIQQNAQYNQHPAVVSTSSDLVWKIKGMYRLLDLIGESGSSGYG